MKLQNKIALNKKKTSYLKTIKTQDKTQMQQVCNLLNWSEEQYCMHQFEVYNSVLKRRFTGCLTCLLEEVSYSPLMCSFFKNEWSKRNQVNFLPFVEEYLRISQSYVCPNEGLHLEWNYENENAMILDEYLYCHNPYVLIKDKDFLNNMNYTLNIIFKK